MSNMSYCRFENTASDIQDCVDAFHENNWNLEAMIEGASNEYEARAMKRFVELCKEVAEGFNNE